MLSLPPYLVDSSTFQAPWNTPERNCHNIYVMNKTGWIVNHVTECYAIALEILQFIGYNILCHTKSPVTKNVLFMYVCYWISHTSYNRKLWQTYFDLGKDYHIHKEVFLTYEWSLTGTLIVRLTPFAKKKTEPKKSQYDGWGKFETWSKPIDIFKKSWRRSWVLKMAFSVIKTEC